MKSRKIVIVIVSVLAVLAIAVVVLTELSAIRYSWAHNLLSAGMFEDAGKAYAALGGYEESSLLAMYSRACAAAEEGDYYTASQAFSSLGNYKDCQLLAAYYEARQSEVEGEYYPTSYLTAIKSFSKIQLFRDSNEHIAACRDKAYEAANAAGEKGNYSIAVTILDGITPYKDSRKLSAYYTACNELKKENFQNALDQFTNLGTFNDSADKLKQTQETIYKRAEQYLEENDYRSAYSLFEMLGDYSDAAERILKSKYDRADVLLEQGNYDAGYRMFTEISDYSDAAQRIPESKYERAVIMLNAEQYDEAYALFEEISDYQDATERIQKSKYERAEACMAVYDFDGAELLYGQLGDYEDAADKLKSITTAKKRKLAEDYKAAGRYGEARNLYLELQDEEKATECRYLFADSIADVRPWDAWKDFTNLGTYKDSAERAKELYGRRYEQIGETDKNGLRMFYDPVSGWGLMDKNADIVVEPVFTAIQEGQKGQYMVLVAGKAGAIKSDGSQVVDFIYSGISLADNDRYLVKMGDNYGILDADGNTVVECLYQTIRINEDQLYAVKGANGMGLLKMDGSVLIPAEYSQISKYDDNYMVEKNSKKGVLNKDGTTLLPAEYSKITKLDYGYMVEENGKFGLMNLNGSVLIPAEYSRITELEDNYMVESNGEKGILKKDGTVLVAVTYDDIKILADGRFEVTSNNRKGILDSDGSIIISPMYGAISSMSDGRFVVADFSNANKKGILGSNGKVIIAPQYESIKLENTGNYTVVLNSKSGIVSYDGKVLHEPDMEEIKEGSNDGKYLMFKQNGLYGFMKADTFEVTVPAEWKDAKIMYKGYAYIKNNLDQWGVIDEKGNVTVKPQWSSILWYEDCGCAVQDLMLRNSRGALLCNFEDYFSSYYNKKIVYLGQGVFTDGDNNNCIFDTKVGKMYSYKTNGYDITDLKLYDDELLTGRIYYKKSSYSGDFLYGVIDGKSKTLLSDNGWDQISGIPGVAKKGNLYGWIGKDGKDLLTAKYDYIRSNAFNGQIIVANYNDRGNLVYSVLDDTTGKVLESNIKSENEAIEYRNKGLKN